MPLFAQDTPHVCLFSDIIIKSALFHSQFDLRNLQNPYLFAIKTAPDDFCKPKGWVVSYPGGCGLLYPIAVLEKDSDLETLLPM